MGCASEAHGAATAKWAFRRRLGIAAFRANARLLIGNMRHVRRAAAPRSAAAAARGAAEGTLGTEGTRYCDADGLHTARESGRAGLWQLGGASMEIESIWARRASLCVCTC